MTALTVTITSALNLSADQISTFMEMHQKAQRKSGPNLKDIHSNCVNAAAFMVQIHDSDKIKGQCLLYDGASDCDKFASYPDETKTRETLIISSVAGLSVFKEMIDAVEKRALEEGYTALTAKTRKSNFDGIKAFQEAGFSPLHSAVLPGDDYESVIFVKQTGADHPAQTRHIAYHETVAPAAAPA